MVASMIVVVASMVTAARLIMYQRSGSCYRPLVSLFAYFLIVCSGGQAIDIMFNGSVASVWQAGISVAIMILVLRTRGNVACIARFVL